MKKFSFLFLFLLSVVSTIQSQEKDPIILTIEEDPVYASEFKYVYTKNLELVQDQEQKSIDGYLDLFIDFKLKVREAYAQNLQERESYLRDFRLYENQLSRSFLYEERITEELILEAYERSKEEIHASHILMSCAHDAVPQDTLIAYNKAMAARERALKGEDFNNLIKELSEEPGLERNNGDLGYFTAFKMVYPFEAMAYNTPEGEISEVVRTQYGYHVINILDRRERRGQIAVSHIMISTRNDSTDAPKKRIEEVYQLLQQGESYDQLAEQYSDDRRSGANGGRMKPFSRGELRVPEFEDVAYAMKTIGEISEPIQTPFGWHIIRLDQTFPLPTLEEDRVRLTTKVKDGERATMVNKAVIDQIKERVGFEEGPAYIDYFMDLVGEEVLDRKWVLDSTAKGLDETLFIAGDTKYIYADLARYLYEQQRKIRPHQQKKSLINYAYEEFAGKELRKAFKVFLEANEPGYGPVVREYKEGLLIFEVMGENVWNKARVDTLGQEAYFEKHIDRYQWKRRADADVFTAYDEATINSIQKMLGEGQTADAIKTTLNTKEDLRVVVSSNTFEEGAKELPSTYNFTKGTSKIYNDGSSYILVNTKEVLPAGPKEFEDVKGRVLSDYQADLEVDWMKELHNKYEVKVDQKTLNNLKKEFGQ